MYFRTILLLQELGLAKRRVKKVKSKPPPKPIDQITEVQRKLKLSKNSPLLVHLVKIQCVTNQFVKLKNRVKNFAFLTCCIQ